MEVSNSSVTRILDAINDGLYFVNKDRVITYWNKAAENISGFSADEVMGRSCSDNVLIHVDEKGTSLCASLCPLAATMNDDTPREANVYMHHKNGHRIPVSVRVGALKDDDGKIIGGIELFTDISNYEANELRLKELENLALLDNLTQMANRHYLEQELESKFHEYKRYNVPFGILLIDIDHFKKINDTHGHDVGDEILKCIGNTLANSARPFDLFGRWGGEEFLGILKNVEPDQLENISKRILKLVATSYVVVDSEKISVTISIGTTPVKNGDDKNSLIKRADELLYKSKKNGRNQVTFS